MIFYSQILLILVSQNPLHKLKYIWCTRRNFTADALHTYLLLFETNFQQENQLEL